ncbi:glycosyl hydrolase family 18 protein [Neobacillus dielmonensis]|uniref:glycosyl hydrolase family 18 protein n=1 Tax=Neobacillus dielmonensis TaxID=1347369 RepID=UPI0005A81D30|nr:glycoside hydrolase family 18 protein [Neobacillus dielmonensis]
MKKRHFLLTLVIMVTFVGGILIGVLLSGHDDSSVVNKTTKTMPGREIKVEEKQLPKVEKDASKVLIGYVQDFRDPNMIDYEKLTHVIFSFAHPTKDGSFTLTGDQALDNLRTIVSKSKETNTKVMLAIGGWYHMNGGESYDYFKPAIANPDSRAKLVNELVSFAEREKLDGIDIDFEHPHSAEDAQYLAAFAKELSDRLHPEGKELSIAVYAKIHAVTLTETNFVKYEPSMFQSVDHVNIMAYDGQWDDGYHAANLSPYPYTEKIVNYWASFFDENQYSKEKLVLGVPFYAQPEDPNSKQVSFAAIMKQDPNNAANDMVSMNGTTYYYNGAETMKKKTALAVEHGFGGMMLWEAGLDAQGPLSLTESIAQSLEDSQKSPVKYYSVKP